MSVNKILKPAKDPYEVLGIAFGASDAEITKAYRNLARSLHPDKLVPQNLSKSETAHLASRFQDVQAARSFLFDVENAEARRKYDAKQASEQMRLAVDKAREAGMSERRKRMRDELKMHEAQAVRSKKEKSSGPPQASHMPTKESLAKEGLKMREKYAAKEAAAFQFQREQAAIALQKRQIRLKWSRKRLKADGFPSPSEDSIAKMLAESCGDRVERVQMLGDKGNAALISFSNGSSCDAAVELYRTSETWRAAYVNKEKQRTEDLRPSELVSKNDREDVSEWKLRQSIERESLMRQMESLEKGETPPRPAASHDSPSQPFPPHFPKDFGHASFAIDTLEQLERILLKGIVSDEVIHGMKLAKKF
jgi:curved DNA-binding protein CbpA